MQTSWLELLKRYPEPGQLFVSTALISLFLTAGAYFFARSLQLMPQIRGRDVHTVRKPRVGGVAMWLAVAVGFGLILADPGRSYLLRFGGGQVWGIDKALWGILIGMCVLLVAGLIDDLRGLSWKGQLGAQFLAATALVVAGVGVPFINLPFGAHLQLPSIFSGLFTVVWTMTAINVVNWLDGLDGLAGSVGVTASIVLVMVGLRTSSVTLAPVTLALLLGGAALGYLPWNWYPSKLFMGTVGSQLLGFLLAVIAIVSGGKLATAVLVLGVPVLDAVIVIYRRVRAGVSPFVADQRHLHHRLLKLGIPTPWVVILINVVSLAFGVMAVRTANSTLKGLLTLILVGCMGLFVGLTYVLEKKADIKPKS